MGSPLLHHYPERPTRWTYDLAGRYAARVAPAWAAASRPCQVIAVGVPFPLRQAVAVLDAVVMMDHGAGKTTLLHLAVGLLSPSAGSITVLGGKPGDGPDQLAKVGFVAQDTPTYAGLSVRNTYRWART